MGRWTKPRERVTDGQLLLAGFGSGTAVERPRIATMPVALGVAATSREASAAAQAGAERDRTLILSLIRGKAAYGATCDEVAAATGKAQNQISGRFTELCSLGLIQRSGERRPTRSGNTAAVWVAVQR